jgi:hypothetical protein
MKGGAFLQASRIPATALAFLARLVVQRPERRRAQGVAGFLAHNFEIGAVASNYVEYASEDFNRAHVLLQVCGYRTAFGPHSERSAKDDVVRGHAEDSERLVAARPMHFGHVLGLPSALVCAPSAQLARLPVEVILVCETFESLLLLDRMPWVARHVSGRRCLAVFRGNLSGTFSHAAVETLLDRSDCPILALVSFGPQGLALAAQLPRLEGICYPDLGFLTNLPDEGRSSVFKKQTQLFASTLLSSNSLVVADAWAKMKKVGSTLALELFPLDVTSEWRLF